MKDKNMVNSVFISKFKDFKQNLVPMYILKNIYKHKMYPSYIYDWNKPI